mmetsp:Transcript_5257/g.13704  ORF Transcript_5257/g.13704 Transcript_5257/m.13704 type:complete len:210 (+) Transcript_5257:158-787(+)
MRPQPHMPMGLECVREDIKSNSKKSIQRPPPSRCRCAAAAAAAACARLSSIDPTEAKPVTAVTTSSTSGQLAATGPPGRGADREAPGEVREALGAVRVEVTPGAVCCSCVARAPIPLCRFCVTRAVSEWAWIAPRTPVTVPTKLSSDSSLAAAPATCKGAPSAIFKNCSATAIVRCATFCTVCAASLPSLTSPCAAAAAATAAAPRAAM